MSGSDQFNAVRHGKLRRTNVATRTGFAAELRLKDFKLLQGTAQSVSAQKPRSLRAIGLYDAFVDGKGRGRDFPAMIESLKGGSHG
jgi:3-hydroxyisobutyrate dehydrogenase-like beta-hydroxyacid dehydrogenase